MARYYITSAYKYKADGLTLLDAPIPEEDQSADDLYLVELVEDEVVCVEFICNHCDEDGRVEEEYGNYMAPCPVCRGTKKRYEKVE